MIQRHINCKDQGCKVCLKDCDTLRIELEKKTGIDSIDQLCNYRKWLDRMGIKAETEWGWPTTKVFDEVNINKYIKDYVG